jgi:flagellum-specific peptidoglycan hydrolase FlgJ
MSAAVCAPGEAAEITRYTTPKVGTVECHTNLRMRSGPSTAYLIEGRLACGSKLEVIARDKRTGWYEVKTANGRTGWTSNKYISLPKLQTQDRDELTKPLNSMMNAGKLLDPATVPCDASSPQAPLTVTQSCLTFDKSIYGAQGKANYEKKVNAATTERGKQNTFINYLAPAAVFMQGHTGFPASVILAQVYLESAMGTSRLFKEQNNFAGLSCFNEKPMHEESIDIGATYKTTISIACDTPRPDREGAYYESFDSLFECAKAYLSNLLDSKQTAAAYADVRDAVNAHPEGKPADWQTVIAGLHSYAADPSYQSSLTKLINELDLTRFDQMESCE